MEPLTWTGMLSFIDTPFVLAVVALLILQFAQIIIFTTSSLLQMTAIKPHGIPTESVIPRVLRKIRTFVLLILAVGIVIYLLAGAILNQQAGIIGAISHRLLPVWITMAAIFSISFYYQSRLGFYGRLFQSGIALVGFGLVVFWLLVGIFGALDLISTHDELNQLSGMKNKLPGTALPNADGRYPYYLLGGDNLARDVFSRVVKGAWIVVQIAPLAAIFSFMIGIVLGLPAGYKGGWLDHVLSFVANLILAFPVILLFYLLVTPEIDDLGVPQYMALVLFLFPIIFYVILIRSRYQNQPKVLIPLISIGILVLGWLYLSFVSAQNSPLSIIPAELDGFDLPRGVFVVFVAVVFINSPTVFRIVRGLTMDIKTRDYVSAAKTRGETQWFIMLWEILPNVRGPLIVDFCLRIGYTTILLGTLGFFGLGLPPDSPDWGSTINEGRKLLSIFPHPALPPAIALMSLVLGLNLLADGLRELSLRD